MLIRRSASAYRPVPSPRPRPVDDGCAPACPECGGLQCLCRPRFFAGQLLTEEDLNRLDHYVVEKNKLHNRYLHGWGVVCGLEVVCHPCDDKVIVRPGYALSPCGEDIVVCNEVTVAVCDLIKACKDYERRRWECEPYPYGQDDDCKDQCQQWVLSIRYDEKPSRGVASLTDSHSGCCSKCSGSGGNCGCGGSSGGSCACGEKANGMSKGSGSASRSRRTPLQCEPTTTCEGFKFEVSKFKPNKVGRSPVYTNMPTSYLPAGQLGTMKSGLDKDGLRDCLEELAASLPPKPGGNPTPEELYEWCCRTKEAMQDYFRSRPTYDCLLDEKLAAIRCPRPDPQMTDDERQKYASEVQTSVSSLYRLGQEYLRYCACSALLPPCPDPVGDPRVPLAVITVCGDDCTLVKVCNLDVRQYVITFPMIQHYLKGLGVSRWFQERLQALCCPREEVRTPARTRGLEGLTHLVANQERPRIANFVSRPVRRVSRVRTAESGAQDFSKLLLGALAQPNREFDTFSLLAGAMGAVDEAGTPLATNLELENPLQALMVNGLVTPLLKSFMPQRFAEAAQPIAAKAVKSDTEESKEADIARMQSELDALRKTATEQQASINILLDELRKMQEGK
ncbi:MAG TPA: hypothetical protein VJ183_01525 [Chloroflexia bacterium]|nr:hypothetical protein [Chloroflexia bacterium]